MTSTLRPKLLFLYVGLSAHNPTIPTLISELQRHPSRIVCLDVSTSSTDSVAQHISRADLVIIEGLVLRGRIIDSLVAPYYFPHEKRQSSYYSQVLEAVFSSGAPLALLAGNYDLHSPLPGALSRDEQARFSYLIWPYVHQPLSRSSVLLGPYADYWMEGAIDPLTNWLEIAHDIPHQIEYAHAITEVEVQRPRRRLWDVCVPGIKYRTRMLAQHSANNAHLRVAPYRRLDGLISGSFAGLRILSPERYVESIALQRAKVRKSNMLGLLGRSEITFACGSGYQTFVRKFLEIPACYSAMLAYPARGMESLGFRDGEHYIACTPESFGHSARQLLSRPGLLNYLRRNALELVLKNHTISTRVKDLLGVLETAATGNLRQARFIDGRLAATSQ